MNFPPLENGIKNSICKMVDMDNDKLENYWIIHYWKKVVKIHLENGWHGKWQTGKLMKYQPLEKGSKNLIWKMIDMENDKPEN